MSPLSPGMTPSQVGERAEAAVMAALTATGRHVLTPNGQRRYDLAYEEDGRLIRVQVKCGRVRDGAITFVAHSIDRGTVLDYRNDADMFGIYCHDRGEVYMVPVSDVPRRAAHLRLEAPKNGQSQKVRWARQYLLARNPIPRLIEGVRSIGGGAAGGASAGTSAVPADVPRTATEAVTSPIPVETPRTAGGSGHRQLSILTDVDVCASLGPMTTSESLPLAACCAPLSQATISADEAAAAATLFKALADPHRVLIVNRLLACGEPVCVCEMNEELALSQPTVSFHLKKLVAAGLLAREQRGTWAYYSIVPAAMDQLAEMFKTKESV